MPVTQVEKPIPDNKSDPILVWLQRPELGPIWAYLLLIVSMKFSSMIEPKHLYSAVAVYVSVVFYTLMHILSSVCLFVLPKRFPRFKRFVCWSSTILMVVTVLVGMATTLHWRMVWYHKAPEHTPLWDLISTIHYALNAAYLALLMGLPVIAIVTWSWDWMLRRMAVVEAELKAPRKSDPMS